MLIFYYVYMIIGKASSEFEETTSTPASNHHFTVDESSPRFDETRSTKFHHIVADFLFLFKRARPYLKLSVLILTTRVRDPVEDDLRKIRLIMRYLLLSSALTLTIGAYRSLIVN